MDQRSKSGRLNWAFENFENDKEAFFKELYDYTLYIVRICMKGHPNSYDLEDFVHDIYIELIKAYPRYEDKGLRFSTYCSDIIEKKYITVSSRKTKIDSRSVSLDASDDGDVSSAYTNELEFSISEALKELEQIGSNPESKYLRKERYMEILEYFQKYMMLVSDSDKKPYQLSAFAFSAILFPLIEDSSKMLTSPKWAYDELGPSTVYKGSEEFERAFNQNVSSYRFNWSDKVIDAMDESYDKDRLIGEIIYKEEFSKKDFENWSQRLQKHFRNELLQQELELD